MLSQLLFRVGPSKRMLLYSWVSFFLFDFAVFGVICYHGNESHAISKEKQKVKQHSSEEITIKQRLVILIGYCALS